MLDQHPSQKQAPSADFSSFPFPPQSTKPLSWLLERAGGGGGAAAERRNYSNWHPSYTSRSASVCKNEVGVSPPMDTYTHAYVHQGRLQSFMQSTVFPFPLFQQLPKISKEETKEVSRGGGGGESAKPTPSLLRACACISSILGYHELSARSSKRSIGMVKVSEQIQCPIS